ncbi:sugar phosphate isomerase/epimerase [bacterium]|nr:MAG: sugar phosphate isomerase/epimerase [bacterium]
MFTTGLVSVTFRALTPHQVVDLCASFKLMNIEWGGDIHVPPGDVARAREVAALTRDAGLKTLCYGSYYRCGGEEQNFEAILESAIELDAKSIRVWAGGGESEEIFPRVSEDLERISSLANAQSREVVLEFHGGTLTHHGVDARKLLDAGQGAFQSLWQPLRRTVGNEHIEENLNELRLVAPFLRHVHVYEWHETPSGRESLSLQGSKQWPRYIEELRTLDLEVPLMLEFVPGDDPDVLTREAAALHEMCGV